MAEGIGADQGGGHTRDTAPGEATAPRRRRSTGWVVAAVIVLVVIGGVAMVARGIDDYFANSCVVYVVNALPQSVTAEIAGTPQVIVQPGQKWKLELTEGSHTARLTWGEESEDVDFTLDGSVGTNILHDPVTLLVAGGAAPIAWERAPYSEDGSGDYEVRWHVGETLVAFEDVDFPFAPTPDEIYISESTDLAYRTGFEWMQESPAEALSYATSSPAAQLRFAEVWLGVNPDDTELLEVYSALATEHDAQAQVAAFLEKRLEDRPLRIAWHLSYLELAADSPALEETYGSLVDAEPESAGLWYLWGRLAKDPAEARRRYERALELEPGHTRALVGLARQARRTGEFDRAWEYLQQASGDGDVAELEPGLPYPEGRDLGEARDGRVTRLTMLAPAPQEYDEKSPPAGVTAIRYPSGELKLQAWLSDAPDDGQKHPAVVYAHGGFSFAGVDWEDAVPFAESGYVLMMPMVRGENGNPGHFECQYGEVDDIVAAGEFLAGLPYVDPDRIFLAGHSAGARLVFLAAMLDSRFRGAAAISGASDYEAMYSGWLGDEAPHDAADLAERRLRNPLAFAWSLRCPLYLFAEEESLLTVWDNQAFRDLAIEYGKECSLELVPGDHSSMVAPSVTRSIELFDQLRGKATSPR